MKKLIYLFLFIFVVFSHPLFSQEQLNNLNVSWTNVLSGKVLQEPVRTSYGFCLLTDARTISAFTDEGHLLWEKNAGRQRDILLSVLPGDFVAYVNEKGRLLHFLNPSGCEIWNKPLDFAACESITCGRDGRFFVRGKNHIQCFGINGISKWVLQVSALSSLDFQELPDGSFVAFLKETVKGKTKGLRISPFGEILEEITFSGEVVQAVSAKNGILLVFSDCSAGLFSLEDDFSINKWVLKSDVSQTYSGASARILAEDEKTGAYLLCKKDEITVFQFNLETGLVFHSFKIHGINGLSLSSCIFNSGFFLSDSSHAVLYSEDGREIVNWKLPQKDGKNGWNYSFYTNNETLVFCHSNWTLNGYKAAQGTKPAKNQHTKNDYSRFYSFNTSDFAFQFSTKIDNPAVDENRISVLESGNYFAKEQDLASDLITLSRVYLNHLSSSDFGTRIDFSVFDTDTIGLNTAFKQLGLFGTDTFSSLNAQLLKKCKNKTLQHTLLVCVADNGYDPDGEILKALEYLSDKINAKDQALLCDVCDSVYSICRFMGRPAFYSKGKEILTKFLYPSYDVKTRTYARQTLKNIADLEL